MKCYMTGKPCDYFKDNLQNQDVFIICPFGFPFDSIYSDGGIVQKALVKHALHANRSDQTMRLGSIMCQSICKEIIERKYLIADISKPNPNVYYELGLAYALKRRLIILIKSNSGNEYIELFKTAWGKEKTFCEYENIKGIEDFIEELELDDSCSFCEHNIPTINTEKNILIIENGQSDMPGLYEIILKECQNKFEFNEDLLKSLSAQEQKSFNKNDWREWNVETIQIDSNPNLKDIMSKIAVSRICLVDTSAYNSCGNEVNPYMYFFLGIAHGLEKEVVPLTNAIHSQTPFDVKGLWHIFFSDEESLKNSLMKIIPRISVEYHKEREGQPYSKIWDRFLLNNKSLSIIYCGRPNTGQEKENRGRRINIDSWDSKTVSEATFYLAQKYPTAQIKPASPVAKADTNGNVDKLAELTKCIKSDLSEKNSSFLIIGSPDVSDYAEVVLAKIYGIEPYNKNTLEGKNKRFVFHKDNLTSIVFSSFYRAGDESKVAFFGSIMPCQVDKTSGVTYGVLTIADNPFNEDEKVIVLSGFTGLATFGLMRLLIDVTTDKAEDYIGKRFNEQLKDEIIGNYNEKNIDPFSALVKFEFETDDEAIYSGRDPGDNRRISNVWVTLAPSEKSR